MMFLQKKAAKIVIIVLACAILLGGGILIGSKMLNKSKATPVTPQKTVDNKGAVQDKIEITSEVVKEKISTLGELVTAEYDYTSVGNETDKKALTLKNGQQFTIPFTSSGFVYSYDGTIKAGINFEEIDVVIEENQIVITLPEAIIISSELDDDSFELYDQKNSIFNPISVSDVSRSTKELKENAESRALKKGLLKTAQENAEFLIRNLMQSTFDLTGTDYEIVIKTAK